ncbi:MAG: hypothetical protein IJF92_03185 [Bacilli bacterium]|nr:hypothetical protein [Bacilli bacterium]
MGVFEKLKNALFEEEYVEVEEKTKKEKPKREKSKKKNNKEESPIAKKVVIPDKKEEVEEIDPVVEKPLDEDFDVEPLTHTEDHRFNFPIVDDTEFEENKDYSFEEEKEPELIKPDEEEEIKPLYTHDKEKHNLYGIDESNTINVMDYGSYEQEKKVFRPSPIISPIYGVLDKNYKKEEIVNKKEVRLTSSYAKENLSVDDVRNKAYGASVEEEKPKHVSKEVEEQDDLLVDLSSNSDKPEVKEITVGDAEEYFNDLGLEYNNDYKDVSKEKATGRRAKKEEVKEDKSAEKQEEVKETKEENSDDNLFDLIDSMYDENNE